MLGVWKHRSAGDDPERLQAEQEKRHRHHRLKGWRSETVTLPGDIIVEANASTIGSTPSDGFGSSLLVGDNIWQVS